MTDEFSSTPVDDSDEPDVVGVDHVDDDDDFSDGATSTWLTGEVSSLAGLTLALASLLSISAGGIIAEALQLTHHSFKTVVAVPATHLVVAVAGMLLGLHAANDWDSRGRWPVSVGRAAAVVAAVAFVVNVVAVGFALSVSSSNGPFG